MTWECGACGAQFPDQSKVLGGWCPSCVPSRRELEELVYKWRNDGTGNVDWNEYNEGVHEAMRAAADELEETIEGRNAR